MMSFIQKMLFIFAIGLGLVGSGFSDEKISSKPLVTLEAPSKEKPLKVAVLDLNHVVQESDVMAYIIKAGEEYRAALKQNVEGYEKTLREKEIELRKLQNRNDPFFEKSKKIFESEVAEVQRRISGRGKIIEKAFGDARAQVMKKVMSLVAELAEEEAVTLVIPKSVVMFQEESYEITERILARLNATMPTLKINVPEEN